MANEVLSVVIPHWNGKQYLETCLDALLKQTYAPIEIIIVDNASEDGSQAYIREHYPQVTLIELPENRGFTGACNAGMEAAKGDYVCLLNNDTEVDAGWAEAVVDAFKRHPQAGMVASKMLLFDKRDHIHTAGDGFSTDGRPFNRGVWEKDEGQYDEEAYVFSACGGSSVYRRALIDDIGLLDDDFFFLMEDVDYAWRAQLAGWQALYTPHAIVYHHLSATGGGKTASFYDGRNSIYLLVKDIPNDVWRKYGGKIIKKQFKLAWDALRAWRGEAARAHLRGMLVGASHIPRMWRKRKQVQATRRISQQDLDARLTPIEDLNP
jgi:GT2 family glycosyltransferase